MTLQNKRKIAIAGCRGIPNKYGGFEQFAERMACGLTQKGWSVHVYCSHNHPYTKDDFNGVHLIRCFDPEYLLGLSGQFIYDLNCILDSRKRGFDIVFQLGYTTSTLFAWLHSRKNLLVYNMDGMEWQRSKYPSVIRWYLKYAEKWGVRAGDYLVADSSEIQKYYQQKYAVRPEFIPYGADVFHDPDPDIPAAFSLTPGEYDLLIARLQPDNHVEEIIKGHIQAENRVPLVVVGSVHNTFGKMLHEKYSGTFIHFLGGIFDAAVLNNLRYFSNLYFHGHSAGGTNPSLLEAMAASCLVCAFDCNFNRAVLNAHALYFKTPGDIARLLDRHIVKADYSEYIEANLRKIREIYSWESIIDQYHHLFSRILEHSSLRKKER